MDAETLAAIAAIISGGIAVAAAVSAKRSADQSAAAEERSAKAAVRSAHAAERSAEAEEEAVTIERERLQHERSVREAERAPQLDAGERDGTKWTLAQGGNALVGFLLNIGPGAALVERVWLDGVEGPEAELGINEQLSLSVEEPLEIALPWPYGEAVDRVLALAVNFQSADYDYRGHVRFTLRRSGADLNGQPLWRSAGTRNTRLKPATSPSTVPVSGYANSARGAVSARAR
jgi:hypothetical protein